MQETISDECVHLLKAHTRSIERLKFLVFLVAFALVLRCLRIFECALLAWSVSPHAAFITLRDANGLELLLKFRLFPELLGPLILSLPLLMPRSTRSSRSAFT